MEVPYELLVHLVAARFGERVLREQFEQGYSFDIRNISSSLAHPQAVDDCGFHLAPDDRVGLCVGRGAVVAQLDHVHPPV